MSSKLVENKNKTTKDNYNPDFDFDFVIIGSGFGGSVSAMRLSQKGYRVAVIEEGKSYDNNDFPKSNWNIKKFLWIPLLRCFGIQRMTFLRRLMILHGTGVGGGSLVYANTLMQPNDEIFRSKTWPTGVDWVNELAPHFELSKKMLGVVTNPHLAENDLVLKELSEKMGALHTFHPTEVGVFFGQPEVEVNDPYFNGAGPRKKGCHFCGSCMIGCPTGAKNSLDKNYLYFAKKWGCKIFSELTANKIIPPDEGQRHLRYSITTFKSTSWFKTTGPTFTAKKVIVSGGVLGTIKLLLKNKFFYKTLPKISSRLGMDVRSNGESLLGAVTFDRNKDFSKGISIGCAFHPDANTKIEGVRYPSGSNLLRLMGVPLTENGGIFTRPLKTFLNLIVNFPTYLRSLMIPDNAKACIILLVMQSLESKMKLSLGRSPLTLFKRNLISKREQKDLDIPSYIPVAQNAATTLASIIDGGAYNMFSEVFFSTPMTAHILGGAIMAHTAEEGVISLNHEVFGYPGLYVSDASVIAANLAVNPSLTITALSERFASHFPINSERQNYTEPKIEFSNK
ncbi:MAG: GMC family oxidoreductase [Oligoflexia bacterium]|nr:GMC family oxidoreductase [Oligoflexia bacterium]